MDGKIPSRITSLDDDRLFLLVPHTPEDGESIIITNNGEIIDVGESLSNNEIRYRYILEGEITSKGKNIYRSPQFYGILIMYKDRDIVKAKKMIDHFYHAFDDRTGDEMNHPLILNRDELGAATLRIKATNEYVCALMIEQVFHPDMERVIDCYDANHLNYLFSIPTPSATQDFEIYGQYFISVRDSIVDVKKVDFQTY